MMHMYNWEVTVICDVLNIVINKSVIERVRHCGDPFCA